MKSITRCSWCGEDPLYVEYHDTEWGVPLRDEQKLFEFLILENFQSGLSWITILRKRENFRKALDNFDYKKIALYNDEKITELLQDTGIIRNKLKVKATISNAIAFMEIQTEFGSFSKYLWGFVNNVPIQNNNKSMAEVKANTNTSDKLSNDLKKRGFKFIGSTIVYALMQATGMVNDHNTDCFRHQEVQII